MLLGYRWINADGILAHLDREAEDVDFYNLPSKQILRRECMHNYRQIGWVYGQGESDSPFTISSVYVPRHVAVATLYKRFDTAHLDVLGIRKKHVSVASGALRNWVLNFVLAYDPMVEIRLVAQRHWVEERLHSLTHVGKKRAAGYGEVGSIELTRLTSSLEVLVDDEGALRRHVPAWAVGNASPDDLLWAVPHPPYWDRRNLCLCVRPGAKAQLAAVVLRQVKEYDARA